jgi:hypothetical protein
MNSYYQKNIKNAHFSVDCYSRQHSSSKTVENNAAHFKAAKSVWVIPG